MKHITFALGFLLYTASYAQQPDPKYLNELLPDTIPRVFASGKVSTKNEFDFGAIFSGDMMKNGEFKPSLKLGSEINTSAYEADVFVAPDESYVVFSANRPDGLGRGDLYISFRKQDGTWAPSKSLGKMINTETNDFCPYVTPDGKYLFYASRGDVYWVSTDAFLKPR